MHEDVERAESNVNVHGVKPQSVQTSTSVLLRYFPSSAIFLLQFSSSTLETSVSIQNLSPLRFFCPSADQQFHFLANYRAAHYSFHFQQQLRTTHPHGIMISPVFFRLASCLVVLFSTPALSDSVLLGPVSETPQSQTQRQPHSVSIQENLPDLSSRTETDPGGCDPSSRTSMEPGNCGCSVREEYLINKYNEHPGTDANWPNSLTRIRASCGQKSYWPNFFQPGGKFYREVFTKCFIEKLETHGIWTLHPKCADCYAHAAEYEAASCFGGGEECWRGDWCSLGCWNCASNYNPQLQKCTGFKPAKDSTPCRY